MKVKRNSGEEVNINEVKVEAWKSSTGQILYTIIGKIKDKGSFYNSWAILAGETYKDPEKAIKRCEEIKAKIDDEETMLTNSGISYNRLLEL